MESIIISILSAIQHNPTMKLSTIWNFPNPMLLTAWVTVKVSSGTTPLAAAVIWISAPIMLRLAAALRRSVLSDVFSMKLSSRLTRVILTDGLTFYLFVCADFRNTVNVNDIVFQFFDILFKSRFNSTSYECFIRINSSLFHSFLVNTFQSRV